MSYAEKERLIKSDISSIENIVRHVFNQGYDLGYKGGITNRLKTGNWIIKDDKEQGYDIAGIKTWYIQIMCDKCGFIKTAIEGHTGRYKYCPNCGCRMIEPQEREDI